MSRPLVIGNWKMHGDGAWLPTLCAIADAALAAPSIDVALCVPATLVHRAAACRPDLAIGGQDCHAAREGAYTGSVSASMLRDAGARLVIIGHSERRQAGDDDAIVGAKVAAAHAAALRVVLCVGEDAAARRSGAAIAVACRQLRAALATQSTADLIVAYEPIWAIGRGVTPSPEEIAPVTAGLRATLVDLGIVDVPLLYGGSVTAEVVPSLMADDGLDGLLVGQASLDADALNGIFDAVRKTRYSV